MKQRGEWELAANTLMKMALANHIALDFRAANRAYQEAFQILDKVSLPVPRAAPDATLRLAIAEPATLDMARTADVWSAMVAEQTIEPDRQALPRPIAYLARPHFEHEEVQFILVLFETIHFELKTLIGVDELIRGLGVAR